MSLQFRSTLPRPLRGFGLAVSVLLAACSMAPPAETPAPIERVPDAFSAAEIPGEYAPAGWWRSFEDPGLERLLDEVLLENLDLREAVARVEESRAALGISTAPLFPSATGSASASNSNSPRNTGFASQLQQLLGGLSGDSTDSAPPSDEDEGEVARLSQDTWSASLGFAYELDFWGRLRNDRSAAMADLAAAEADLHTARLAVLAEAINAWFERVDLRSRIALAEEIVGVLEERAELTEGRYDRGIASSFELYQVRQDLQNTRAGLPQLRTLLAENERRLALLIGRYPSEVAGFLVESEPSLSLDPIPAGLPSGLLLQRPDVRSSAARYESARFRVGARKAALLPSINLTASVGLQSDDAGGLFDLSQWVRNLAAGLTAPLFQGGRLRANLSAAEARYAQASIGYARSVLTAVGEVEVALTRLAEERDRLAFLSSQVEESQASVGLQSRRYASGVAGYTDYLDALRAHLIARSTLTTARRDFALARLSVHRALGGGWVAATE